MASLLSIPQHPEVLDNHLWNRYIRLETNTHYNPLIDTDRAMGAGLTHRTKWLTVP